jgi:hypothetical protein
MSSIKWDLLALLKAINLVQTIQVEVAAQAALLQIKEKILKE